MTIQLQNISKSFNDRVVLHQLTVALHSNESYCLMGPSGMGKTTLLRILLGLEKADSGSIIGIKAGDIAVMFQENRLCEELTPIDNVLLVMKGRVKRETIRANLQSILPANCLDQPVSELSGGMKRRVALARTMNFTSKLIVMDEPFTGLDLETKKIVIQYIQQMRKDRTLLITTHQEEDVELLGAQKLMLQTLLHKTTEQ